MSLHPRSTWALGVLASATPFVVLGCWFPWVVVSPYHDGHVPWAFYPGMQSGFHGLDWLVLATLAVGWVALATAGAARAELGVVSLTGGAISVTLLVWGLAPSPLDALYPTGDAVFVPGFGLSLLLSAAGYLLLGGVTGLLAGPSRVAPEAVRRAKSRT